MARPELFLDPVAQGEEIEQFGADRSRCDRSKNHRPSDTERAQLARHHVDQRKNRTRLLVVHVIFRIFGFDPLTRLDLAPLQICPQRLGQTLGFGVDLFRRPPGLSLCVAIRHVSPLQDACLGLVTVAGSAPVSKPP